MKKKINDALVNLKDAIDQNISPRKQKIIEAALTIPMIAATTMSGVSAGGCPYGLTNCPYPGQCRRYIDSNGNGQCDFALADASTQTSTTSSGSDSQTTTQDTSTTSSSGSSSGDSSSTSSSGGADIQNGSSDPSDVNNSTIQDPSSGLDNSNAAGGTDFHILPVSLLIIGAYLFTHYLFSKGILKPKQHKRLWNLLILGSYLGTSITGVLLIFMVNLGISLAYRGGLSYWHVELALLMVIGTIIHFHIYRKPFKNMFKVLFNFKSSGNNVKQNETPEHKPPSNSK